MKKRVFVITLDSLGIGAQPDYAEFDAVPGNTLKAVSASSLFFAPTLTSLGMFNIDGNGYKTKAENPRASFARLCEKSAGKDTTIGHWELMGLITKKPFPIFPHGFPSEFISEFEKRAGVSVLCNKPYSGTQVIEDLGVEHLKSGDIIVYTSGDSVLQIAACEDIVPVEKLYEYCRIARSMCTGNLAVARVIARPFIAGADGTYTRTTNRKDFSLPPPAPTALDYISEYGRDCIGVGKIYDVFAGRGITESIKTKGNAHGIQVIRELLFRDFNGLAFINLVDFDTEYGHRNDIDGYAKALSVFDAALAEILSNMRPDDILIITADHGCDPSTPGTDHSREYVPMLICGGNIRRGVNLGTRAFSDLGATLLQIFNIPQTVEGVGFFNEIK